MYQLRIISISFTVIERKENDSLIIEAKIVKDPSPNILKPVQSDACPVCSRGLIIKHTV